MRGARTCGRARRGKGSVQPKRPRSPPRSMAPSAGEAPRRRLRQRRASRAGRVAWPIATARRQRGRWVRDNFLHWLLARPMPDNGPISQGRRPRPPARPESRRAAHGKSEHTARRVCEPTNAARVRARVPRVPARLAHLQRRSLSTLLSLRDAMGESTQTRYGHFRGANAREVGPKVSGGTNRGSPYELCEGACIFLESYHYRMAM